MGFLEYHPKDNMIRIALLACTAALAAADADALYGYAGHHLGHLGYAGHHVVHAAPVHHGYGVTNVANTVGIHGAPPAAIPAVHGAYAGAGRYVANSAGVVHVAKREAEPEADAEALYHSYGGYGLGHRVYSLGHGYGYGHHLGYSSLGYGHHGYGLGYSSYYGKRDAEAEPEADALYGAYGYGYGLGHRTYSLGYGRYFGHGYGYGRGYGYGHGYGYYG